MKLVTLGLSLLITLNVSAAPECTPEAQQKIDSLLGQIQSTQDEMKKIDLEFEVRTVSYNYINCRKQPIQRDIASTETIEIQIIE